MSLLRTVAIGEAEAQLAEFLDYCRQHGAEHDESYLPPGEPYRERAGEPGYLLLDGDRVAGAVSLFRGPRFRGRFRIFHSVLCTLEAYTLMWEAIYTHTSDLERVYLFLPEALTRVRGFLE